jgi:hypothetical protein
MKISNFTRRQFGVAVAGTLAARGMARSDAEPVRASAEPRPPREVWVASMCLVGLNAKDPQEMCKQLLNRMEEVTPFSPAAQAGFSTNFTD